MDADGRGTEEVKPGRLASAVILHGLVHWSLRHAVDSLRANVLSPLARLGTVDVSFHSWDVAAVQNPRGGKRCEVTDRAEVARPHPESTDGVVCQVFHDVSVAWQRLFMNDRTRHCARGEEEVRELKSR